MGAKRAVTSPKRAAPSPASSKRQAKASKKAPVPESLTALLSDLSDDLPASVIATLRAAVPCAVVTERKSWHDYEKKVVDLLFDTVETVSGERREAIEGVKARMHAHEIDGHRALEDLERLATLTTQKHETRSSTAAARVAADERLEERKNEVERLHIEKTDCETEHKRLLSEKAELQANIEKTFVPLRDGVYNNPNHRTRPKVIAQLRNVLEQSQAPASLSAAVSVAVAEKNRSEFANASVRAAEDVFSQHVARLGKSAEESEARVGVLATRIQQAEHAVEVAATEASEAYKVSSDADTAWAEAEGDLKQTQRRIKDHDHVSQGLHRELEQLDDKLSKLLVKKQDFLAFCDQEHDKLGSDA